MKLYATVTSERASKGQGGNKYLDIEILVGHKNNPVTLARLTARYTDELENYDTDETGSGFILVDSDDNVINWYKPETTKGEKKKSDVKADDICPECGILYGDCLC